MRLKNVTSARPIAGFTLVELMAVITIFAILVTLGVPMYLTFTANTQIRSAADSITGGLRFAQAEAVKRNGPVEFALDEATGWQVNDLADTSRNPLQKFAWVDGAPKALVTTQGTSRVQFDGLGRLARDAINASFDVSASIGGADQRTLRVIVDPWNGIKLCDARLPAADPAGCPQTASP